MLGLPHFCAYPQAATGSAGGTFSLLPPIMPHQNLWASDINNSGVVVGKLDDDGFGGGTNGGAMWTGGSYASLGTFFPTDINATGAMGGYIGQFPYTRAPDGTLTSIGAPGYVTGISDTGDVVGYDPGFYPWVLHDDVIYDLNDLLPDGTTGWDIENVQAISPDGTVMVGEAFHDAQLVGYLLTPNYPGSPALSVSDVSLPEPLSGSEDATFTVTLDPSSADTVTVDYETADGPGVNPASAVGGDYTSKSGTLTFTPGQTSKQVVVPVHADATDEPAETFSVVLSDAVNATIARDGLGTITPPTPLKVEIKVPDDPVHLGVDFPDNRFPVTVTVTNQGAVELTNVRVDGGISIGPIEGEEPNKNSQVVAPEPSGDIGTLAPGAQGDVPYTLEAPARGHQRAERARDRLRRHEDGVGPGAYAARGD